MTYSIWLVPAARDKRYVAKIISDLAKAHSAPKFFPHITIYSGITRYSLALDAVRGCKGMPKLTAQAKAIRTSNYLWKTLYVEVKPNAKLSKLHLACRQRLGEHVRYEFAPHMSLIYKKMEKKEKNQLAKSLRMKCTFSFDRVVLIQSSSKVSEWKRLASVRLS